MGYREHSYDPHAYVQPGRPPRPFDRVQWAGLAVGAIGVALVNSRREPGAPITAGQRAGNRRILLAALAALAAGAVVLAAAVIEFSRS